jgi:hypothetical protein
MSTTAFPVRPATLDELLEYLQRVRAERGNIPLGQSAGVSPPHLATLSVHVGSIGAGKGPMRLVSRGGRDCLIFR